MNVALDTNFAIPGDAGFPLNQAFEAPPDRNQAEQLRQYIMQLRQEIAQRLLNHLFLLDPNTPSKVDRSHVPDLRIKANLRAVVAQLHQTKVYGKGVMRYRCTGKRPEDGRTRP